MVKSFLIIAVMVLTTLGCTKGESGGIPEDSLPIILTMTSNPVLAADNSDPTNPNLWVMTVNQVVQIHATDPTTGMLVDNKVTWSIGPLKSTLDPLGNIDQSGKFTAPATPSWVGVSGRADSQNPRLDGSHGIEIVAAPLLTSFTSSSLTITSGQSVSLTPVFSDGQGQILVGTQVVQASLTSGTPVTESPTATTTYTLVVTNLAGASVRQDLKTTVQ